MAEYVSKEEVELAYKKFKSYIYYDNTGLYMRKQIAEFEAIDFEIKLNEIYNNLKGINNIEIFFNGSNKYFDLLIEKIGYWKIPKKIPNSSTNTSQLLTNYKLEKNIEIKDFIFHVNAPIELHIIAVLWIMKEGQYLIENMDYSYGYVLDKNDTNTDIVNGLRLFKPYYTEYQKWRDRAINSAKNILEENQNIGIISLDIKNFYHCVNLYFHKIEDALIQKNVDTLLTNLLQKIYLHYTNIIPENKENINKLDKSILPIGFLSSGILANWYLIKFDNLVNKKLSPVYYGRYVDDILITVPLGNLSKYSSSKELIEDLFEDNKILTKTEEDKLSYKLEGYDSLEIQNEKIIIMLFDKNEPTSLLDKFKSEIRKSSSEYRFLPNEDLVNENFEQSSSKLIYDGSKNKLRSIKEFQDDKFGISSFLAKKIFLALQSDNLKDNSSSEQIINFFQHTRCLEYSFLWEKIITFFVLTNDIDSIKKFIRQIYSSIKLILNSDKQEIVDNYIEQLSIVISLAISIKIEFFRKIGFFEEFIPLSEGFRNARLVRKNYSKVPLAELINHKDRDRFIDITDQSVSINPEQLLDYEFYPRYIHYHEILLAIYVNKILNGFIEEEGSIKDINNQAQKIFNEVSNSSESTLDYISKITSDKESIYQITLQENICKNNLKVGVANFNIKSEIFTAEYIRRPKIDPIRKKELIKILNQAITENVDLVVLPECSIPFSWLYWIVNFAHNKQIGLVFGLEHVISKQNKAYNLMVTLLPVQLKKYHSLFVDIRVKKHYSPEEERILKGYGYEIPKNINNQVIYNWNHIHFTAFNCFELANINDRAKFKSKVDLVVACEYNKDTKYFSNIVESSARDLHCYFIQSNSAHYGDSRIYQPSSSNYSDILKIKGGENSTLLVGNINIKKLREFQNTNYDLQGSDKSFKPTPPDYDKDNLRTRIDDSENMKDNNE